MLTAAQTASMLTAAQTASMLTAAQTASGCLDADGGSDWLDRRLLGERLLLGVGGTHRRRDVGDVGEPLVVALEAQVLDGDEASCDTHTQAWSGGAYGHAGSE